MELVISKLPHAECSSDLIILKVSDFSLTNCQILIGLLVICFRIETGLRSDNCVVFHIVAGKKFKHFVSEAKFVGLGLFMSHQGG